MSVETARMRLREAREEYDRVAAMITDWQPEAGHDRLLFWLRQLVIKQGEERTAEREFWIACNERRVALAEAERVLKGEEAA